VKTYQTKRLECDVLIAGGGISGVCCAIAAARQGARVILCQDRPVLGGNASSEVRMHIVGANTDRPGRDLQLEARESGIIEEIRLENSFRNPQRSPSMADLILYEKCRAESGLRLFLNTSIVSAVVENAAISEVEAVRISTEDRFLIKAKTFVDCTGDGALGVAAGASFFHGREDQACHGESLAPEKADKKTLGSTLLFMARKHEHPVPFIAPSWARKFVPEDFRLRGCVGGPKEEPGWDYGYWWIEWGGHLNTIKDNEEIRDELLSIVMGVWDYVKNAGDHGADHWALDWFGMLPGKRESRRFLGQHILTEGDVLSSRVFADAIAYGGWPIDIHPVEGIDDRDVPPCVQTPVPRLYDIPLRSCVARDIKNLMFAGRNISASHVAFASTRVMATCGVVGEGVGIAAAYAAEKELLPAELANNKEAVTAIRQRLLQQDVYLIEEGLPETENLLSLGTLTSSSEQDEGSAINILSGQNRCVTGDRGVASDRQRPGSHRWMSDPAAGFPAWLAVEWSTPVEASRVEVVFDSGLHRHLTLTQSSRYARKMHWGSGQPEMVRSFRIEIRAPSGEWETLCQIEDNWQRRWRQILPTIRCLQALRIVVNSTWGLDHARVIRMSIH